MSLAYLRVILVRHGQSENNRLMEASFDSYWGKRSADAKLTDPLGHLQAERTGLYLAALRGEMPVPLTHIYTSAMSRALATANTAYETMSAVAQADGSVAELDAIPCPEVWVDICEVGGLFQAATPAQPPPVQAVSTTVGGSQPAAPVVATAASTTTHELMEAAPSDSQWEGVKGMTPRQIAAAYPSIVVGKEVPVLPPSHAGDWPAPPQLHAVLRVNGSCTPYPQSPYSAPGCTAGYVTEHGWWLAPGRETEEQGAARAGRVVDALRGWAARLGSNTEAGDAVQHKPGQNVGSLPAAGAFENAIAASETFSGATATASVSAANKNSCSTDADRLRTGQPIPSDLAAGHARRYGGGAAANAAVGAKRPRSDEYSTATTADASPSAPVNSYEQAQMRARGTGSVPASGGEAIALVCHGDFIDHFIRSIVAGPSSQAHGQHSAGNPSAPPLQFCSSNGSVSIIDVYPDGGARIVRLNDCRHLVPLEQAGLPTPTGPAASAPGDAAKAMGEKERLERLRQQLRFVATSVGGLLTGSPL